MHLCILQGRREKKYRLGTRGNEASTGDAHLRIIIFERNGIYASSDNNNRC